MPLIGNALKPLAKSVLIPLGLTAAELATNPAVQKKMFGSGTRPSDLEKRTAIIISKKEINDITKIVKSLEQSGLLIKIVSETIKKYKSTKIVSKVQKGGFLGMLLGTLGAILWGNMLVSKGTFRNGERTIRAGQIF